MSSPEPVRMFRGLGQAGAAAAASPERRGLLRRLVDNLSQSRRALTAQIQTIAFDPADETVWEQIEEALILADCGVPATALIVNRLETEAASGRLRTGDELTSALQRVIADLMRPAQAPLDITARPTVILVVGVNGTGKTTTIGKLAEHLRRAGGSVVIGAADTFRAAAGDQLATWAQRAGADFVASTPGQDPAAVAFDAVAAAESRSRDCVLIDTAGRLHTQTNLMAELTKIRRVITSRIASAPHETLLVIDATTGQNGLQQARLFSSAVDVSGVCLTKLDGTAKGGIAIAIAQELGLPIKLIGTGETLDDLRPFDADAYAAALIGDATPRNAS